MTRRIAQAPRVLQARTEVLQFLSFFSFLSFFLSSSPCNIYLLLRQHLVKLRQIKSCVNNGIEKRCNTRWYAGSCTKRHLHDLSIVIFDSR